MKSRFLVLTMLFGLLMAVPVQAETIHFFGVQLNVVGEFINAVPVPLAQQEFAPSFQNGQTITGSIAYDTNQPDTDSDPNTGTYLIGMLSLNIPELGLSVSRSSNSMQISSFNDVGNVNDQFFAFVNGVDVFSNNVGLPSPTSFSVLLFGDTSMLADDQLPTSPLDWNFAVSRPVACRGGVYPRPREGVNPSPTKNREIPA